VGEAGDAEALAGEWGGWFLTTGPEILRGRWTPMDTDKDRGWGILAIGRVCFAECSSPSFVLRTPTYELWKKHSTFNVQPQRTRGALGVECWELNVECFLRFTGSMREFFEEFFSFGEKAANRHCRKVPCASAYSNWF
jgi:hypothetical protein